jgi:hypothetical protein
VSEEEVNHKFTSLEQVVELAKQLSPKDKVRLIELLAPSIEWDLSAGQLAARKSLFGLCSDMGPAPSSEDIDEVQRQEWAGFPREEI